MLDSVLGDYGASEVSALDVYGDIFRLGEDFIQRSGEGTGEHKANPIVLGSFGGVIRRRILLEDTFAETLAEFQGADWAITNGLTYWGKANTADRQSKMCAMIFDLDGVDDKHLNAFLYGAHGKVLDGHGLYPIPQYVILSGHNVHLYYVFDEPVSLYPNTKAQLKELKYALTDCIWNFYTSTEWEHPQHQGINQGFRIVGGKTKDGGIVRAFKLNPHPTTIDELNEYVPEESRADVSKVYRESKYSLDQAKSKFPDWYEHVVERGERQYRKAWPVKEDLYNWWLRRVRQPGGASYRHRYFCLMALAIFAVKCGITDRERVKADMESLVPFMNLVDPAHPFGGDGEVKSALECFDMRYVTFPRKDLEKITAIDMPPNKRNYRPQAQHLKIARFARDLNYDTPDGWREGNGRPKGSPNKKHPKCDLIRAYASEHPDASHSAIAKALGVSRTTVIKWLKKNRD